MTTERILIFEDEKAVARSLEFTLQVEGFDVFCAVGGLCIGARQHVEPTLVLLDLRLPAAAPGWISPADRFGQAIPLVS